MNRIPVSLIVGFLGSGKTTLLRHLLSQRHPARHWACVVNEFGAVDVDGARLAGAGADVVSIPGGSIFCQCLVTQFLGVLRDLARTRTDRPLDGVLIEASGVADPRGVRRMFQETGQDQHYTIATIMALVDPGTFFKLQHTLPNLRAQIESADHLILNKTDSFPEEHLRETGIVLRQMNPAARIHRCSFGQVNLDPFLPETPSTSLAGDYTSARDPAFATCHVIHHGPVDEARFRSALAAVQERLYRIKGHLRMSGRLQAVDYSSTGLVVSPLSQPDATAELVMICHRDHAEEVRHTLLRPLVQGAFAPAP